MKHQALFSSKDKSKIIIIIIKVWSAAILLGSLRVNPPKRFKGSMCMYLCNIKLGKVYYAPVPSRLM